MEPSWKNKGTDNDRHGRTPSASGGLRPPNVQITTGEAVELFEAGGVPRSQRSIERYCKNGKLEASLDPDEEIYYIAEDSVAELITLLVEIKNRHSTEPTTLSDHVGDNGGQTPSSPEKETDEELRNELKERNDEVALLKINVGAKDHVIIALKDQLQEHLVQYGETARRLGQAEEKLRLLEAPKDVEMKAGDDQST